MSRRVAITGLGITSCLGSTKNEVLDSLRNARSGIRLSESYRDMGLRSHVAGRPEIDTEARIDRKVRRFMGDAAAYAYIAMEDAIADSGLEAHDISHPKTGLIAGCGGASPSNIIFGADTLRERGVRKLGPYLVPRTMASTVSACLATAYKIKGTSYSISSACATSAHCISNGAEQIIAGNQDIVFAGGGEDEHWSLAMMFDAMGALSSNFNATPQSASRPYDRDRDGFVIAGGGGIVVLEEMERAKKRGARIYAEVAGFGATSDGYDMVSPSGEGAVRCMRQALEGIDSPVDYVNAHGTSTPAGDTQELAAIREVFGESTPPVSSTKSLTGHSLGAAGVHEAIYCLLMLEQGFIAGSANIENLDSIADGVDIVRDPREAKALKTVLSNSFGFGGTNGCLVLRRI
ncbi:MAG: beta-ketoacyl-ACP synthase I [Verrucomicrobia bacterium]|nr:beta-ketoacyl-ACP synthase I [Verrucomicrobiota bacterium]MDA1086400.1 beta-ketoacyl-ACP synthase I [Verrucomicrobiota bacterium]